ncbi:MAG TPA: DUF3800 domain-containing protein [Actinomycetota bacterium]|nr:DUF3800 domain-containing protein [Actinomycetota bacterium]
MDAWFVDDTKQRNPSRPGMGSLLAVGGIRIPDGAVGGLERQLQDLCRTTGFPEGPSGEFKWSPGRDLWMHAGLRGVARTEFFQEVLQLMRDASATVVVVVEDTTRAKADWRAASHEESAFRLLTERIDAVQRDHQSEAFIVIDRPPGNRVDENKFLAHTLEVVQQGTQFVVPHKVAINPVATQSHFVRLLQVADVVTSCTLAYVSGESVWSGPMFQNYVLPIIREDYSRRGGVGLKLHPDILFMNLYHWLLGDEFYKHGNSGYPLPFANRPYATDAFLE